MECEENLPDYSGHADMIEYLDPVGLFSRERTYYNYCREAATHYNITLCDEVDASIIGWFANFLTVLPPIIQDDVEDLSWSYHADFLRMYQRTNSIPVGDISEPFRFLIDESLATAADRSQTDYGVLYHRVDAENIVAEIRRLTAIHSVATINEIDLELAQTGGVIILGQEDQSWACDPAEASSFRNQSRAKVNGHWSKRANNPRSFTSRKKRMAAEYQIQKCGNREYSLLPEASAAMHAPLADGLAPTLPTLGRAPHIYPCCILDAKYSTGAFGLYQRRRDYVRKVRAAENAGRFVPPWLRRLGRNGAVAGFDAVVASEGLQLGAYIAACTSREIPYWRVLYICNTRRTADYFSRAIVGRLPGSRIFAGVVVSLKRATRQTWVI